MNKKEFTKEALKIFLRFFVIYIASLNLKIKMTIYLV